MRRGAWGRTLLCLFLTKRLAARAGSAWLCARKEQLGRNGSRDASPRRAGNQRVVWNANRGALPCWIKGLGKSDGTLGCKHRVANAFEPIGALAKRRRTEDASGQEKDGPIRAVLKQSQLHFWSRRRERWRHGISKCPTMLGSRRSAHQPGRRF